MVVWWVTTVLLARALFGVGREAFEAVDKAINLTVIVVVLLGGALTYYWKADLLVAAVAAAWLEVVLLLLRWLINRLDERNA